MQNYSRRMLNLFGTHIIPISAANSIPNNRKYFNFALFFYKLTLCETSVEIRLHFLLQPQKKIKVDTSVCTGISNMPPAYCILGLRISAHEEKKKAAGAKAPTAFLVRVSRFELEAS